MHLKQSIWGPVGALLGGGLAIAAAVVIGRKPAAKPATAPPGGQLPPNQPPAGLYVNSPPMPSLTLSNGQSVFLLTDAQFQQAIGSRAKSDPRVDLVLLFTPPCADSNCTTALSSMSSYAASDANVRAWAVNRTDPASVQLATALASASGVYPTLTAFQGGVAKLVTTDAANWSSSGQIASMVIVVRAQAGV